MKKTILFLTFSLLLFQPLLGWNLLSFTPSLAQAQDQEDWKEVFNEICAKTQNAMAYSVEELRDFITRCDALQKNIEQLPEPQKTIYTKRLKNCRGVFAYVLASKEQK
jgi:hypothetical protein